MKMTYSKKMMRLRRRDPRLWGAVALMGLGTLLLFFSPLLDGRVGSILRTGGLSGAAASMLYYLPRVLLAAGLMVFFFYIRRLLDMRNRLAALTEEQLAQADRELNSTEPLAKGALVYVTPNFLVSGDYQFEVIPYVDMERIYYAGDLLVVATAGQAAHVVASGAGKKSWAARLEQELSTRSAACRADQSARAAAEKASGKRGGANEHGGLNGSGTNEKGGSKGSSTKRKKKQPQLCTLPKPDRKSALAGGLLMAVPGIAVYMLFCGFAIWGPLLGAMAIFFLISIGYGFGIRGLFVRHKDLGQWNPEENGKTVLILSLAIVILAGTAYHVLLLVFGYKEYGYSAPYVAGHFIGLLKEHNLWSLFRSRMLFGVLTTVVLGFRFSSKKA